MPRWVREVRDKAEKLEAAAADIVAKARAHWQAEARGRSRHPLVCIGIGSAEKTIPAQWQLALAV